MTHSGALERILGALAAAPGEPLALGWATVELERAASELAAELGISAAAFLPASDSIVLGARCRVAYGVLPGGRPLAILEPRTEGRLAGSLARRGEGPAATWTRPADPRRGGAADRRTRARSAPSACRPIARRTARIALLIEGEPSTIDG